MNDWSCLRCLRASGRFHPTIKLCRTCYAAVKAAGLRWCNRCQRTVAPHEFGQSRCNACHTTLVKAWRAQNPDAAERHRAQARAWRQAHPEQARATDRRWQAAHPDRWARYADAYNARRRARRKG